MSDYLHENIIHEILKRLPIKSVIQCCLVSRSWKSLIESSTHLTRKVQSNNQKDPLFLLLKDFDEGDQSDWCLWKNPDFGEYIKIKNPFPCIIKSIFHQTERYTAKNFNVVGTCNGLVCLAVDFSYYGSVAVIWNPYIRKFVALPKLRVSNPKDGTHFNVASYAFGYDSRTNDYKVLRTVSDICGGETEVWSLARGTWKTLTAPMPKDFPCRGDNVRYAFVNGAVHWVQHRRVDRRDKAIVDTVIVLFDMASELFGEIKMPEDLRGKHCFISRYMESIGLFMSETLENSSDFDMWMMKDYGVVESWTKLLTIRLEGPKLCPHGFKQNGSEALFTVGEGRLLTVDLKTKQFGEFAIEEYRYYFLDCFAESLALLGHANAISYRDASNK